MLGCDAARLRQRARSTATVTVTTGNCPTDSDALLGRQTWAHCGCEQIVVSMRKFDCTVWRSAWNTSSG